MMPKILPFSEVRNRLSAVVNSLRQEGRPCFVTKNGRPVAAFLSMDAYEQLMSELEDRADEIDTALVGEVQEARAQYKAGKSRSLSSPRGKRGR